MDHETEAPITAGVMPPYRPKRSRREPLVSKERQIAIREPEDHVVTPFVNHEIDKEEYCSEVPLNPSWAVMCCRARMVLLY
jgi:hypothetical protein